jgi:hypothetical protein
MRKLRIIFGLLVWLAVATTLGYLTRRSLDHAQRDVVVELWEFLSARRLTVAIELPDGIFLQRGDPIFWVDADQGVEQIGEIQQVGPTSRNAAGEGRRASAAALIYPTAPRFGNQSRLVYYSTRDSLGWVVETLLPPEKRLQITQEIAATYATRRAQILQALQPVVISSLKDALQVIEQDLAVAVNQQRAALERLSDRYQEQVVEEEILPLVRQEIWPLVRRRVQPLASEIGAAMWQRASVWRFGWRYLYDRLPLTDRQLALNEWNRFVKQEALPILDRYAEEIVAVQRQILADISQNPRIRNAVSDHLARIIDDPEFREIVWTILRQAIFDNPRLQQTLEAHWNADQTRQAVELAASYVEPAARRIGDLLMGTREAGISPEFAQVLRNQILGKDRRWLMLETAATAAGSFEQSPSFRLVVVRGNQPSINPFASQLQPDSR